MLRSPVALWVGRLVLGVSLLALWGGSAPPGVRAAHDANISPGQRGLASQALAGDARPDLYVTQTIHARGLGRPGSQVVITLRLGNRGESVAEEVVLADMTPPILTNLSYTAAGVTATPRAGMTYVWDLGSLAPGARGEIVVTGYTVGALEAGDVIGNQASISSASEERDPSDNISYLSWTATTSCWLPLALE